MSKIKIVTLTFLIMLIGSLLMGGTILPNKGEDASILVKAGSPHPDNDFRFRWLNTGVHSSLVIFDDVGNTSFLPFDFYSVLLHTHVVKDITDMDTFKIPSSIYADNATHATEATHSEKADKSNEATKADNATHGINGVHSKEANFSNDAFPATAGENETMVFDDVVKKWNLAPTLTTKTVPNAIWEYNIDGKAFWNPITEFMKQYVDNFDLATVLDTFGGILGALAFFFVGIGAIFVFTFVRGLGTWKKGGKYDTFSEKMMKKIYRVGLVLILSLFMSSVIPSVVKAEFPSAGEDGYILAKKGNPDKANDYIWQWLNNPNDPAKKKVIVGFNGIGDTDFTPMDAYSLSGHKHTHDIITDILTYKIPSAALADDCANCSLAQEAVNADTSSHCDIAGEAINCTESEKAKIAKTSKNGLPINDVPDNSVMTYFTDRAWQPMLHQFPKGAQRNSLCGTDDKGKYRMIGKGEIVDEMTKQTKMVVFFIWAVPILLVLCILVAVFMFIIMNKSDHGWKYFDSRELYFTDTKKTERFTLGQRSAQYISINSKRER